MSASDEVAGASKVFLDTNVLVYLLSGDPARADIAQELLRNGSVVSVQVLNEFASVALRKMGLQLDDVQEILNGIRKFCRVEPVTVETHELGLAYSARYGYSIYDSMILAAATLAGCGTLLSEDMQAGQEIAKDVVIRNPFAARN